MLHIAKSNGLAVIVLLRVRENQPLARPRAGDVEESPFSFVNIVQLRFVGSVGSLSAADQALDAVGMFLSEQLRTTV